VAALADPAKAHAMAVRLSELGFPASVSPVRAGNKMLYRVRVGQVRNRAVAESLQQRLLESRGLQGRVVSNP
jgi:cell division septation protein DedD